MRRPPLPFVSFTLAVALAGCSQPPAETADLPPPTVTISQVLERHVTDHAELTGRTAAVESVQVRARVWGHLQKINFTEGAEVRKGDLLFVIDQRPYQAALDRADADIAQSEARSSRLMSDRGRARTLLGTRAMSREEFDRITGDLSEARAAVRSARAAREMAKLNLDYTEVRAPVDGQVGRALVTVGNLVVSGETGGTVLTTIVSVDPMYAYFDVDDQTFIQVRQSLRAARDSSPASRPTVHLGLAHEKGFPHAGTIDFVDNQVDPGTGTMK